MKKIGVIAVLVAVFLLSACTKTTVATESAGGGEEAATVQAEDFAAYAAFGLTYDEQAQQLLYDGERVRYFEDLFPVAENTAGMTFFDKDGTVDVVAQQDLSNLPQNPDGSTNPGGTLTDLRVCSAQEFESRDLAPLLHPDLSTAVAGDPLSEAELTAMYAVYAPYGLSYDAKTDTLTFEGQTVRYFRDILSSNGELTESGKFQGSFTNHWTDSGTVDVEALRDYTKPDQDGNGTLAGIKACTQAEFDARAPGAEQSGYVQHYGAAGSTEVSEG